MPFYNCLTRHFATLRGFLAKQMTKMPLQRTPEINRIVVGDKWVPITTSPTATTTVTTITTSTTVTGSTGTIMKSKVEDSTTKSPQKSDLPPQLTSDKLKELGFDKNEEMLKTIRMRSFVDPRYRNFNLIIS